MCLYCLGARPACYVGLQDNPSLANLWPNRLLLMDIFMSTVEIFPMLDTQQLRSWTPWSFVSFLRICLELENVKLLHGYEDNQLFGGKQTNCNKINYAINIFCLQTTPALNMVITPSILSLIIYLLKLNKCQIFIKSPSPRVYYLNYQPWYTFYIFAEYVVT